MANGMNNEQQQQSNTSNNTYEVDEPAKVLDEHLAPADGMASTEPDSLLVSGCARGTLNDLVADLCLTSSNSNRNSNSATNYGDYTNIRATTDRSTSGSASSTTATQQSLPSTTQSAAPSSSFSFKHFLNSSGTVTAPSTTVTSLDAISTTGSTTTTTTTTTTTSGVPAASNANANPNALQTSTGARPKVPQSASTSLMQQDASSSSCNASKMKRSPRFSSFDSQASLAEYAAGSGRTVDVDGSAAGGACGISVNEHLGVDDDMTADMRRSRLAYGEQQYGGDFFPSMHTILTGASTSTSAAATSSSNSRYVPRSYSSYDMPPPAVVAPNSSPRRRPGAVAGNRDSRPNRLAFSTNQNAGNKMKLDLPLESSSTVGAAVNAATIRTLPNPAEYAVGGAPSAAAAAVLPDFVQDHWLDSWYAHDMHLNSPPNSPICDFGNDDELASGSGGPLAGAAGMCGLPGAGAGAPGAGCVISSGSAGAGDAGSGASTAAKMLPDFLSDGPIIHSSQRLADVAVGLPSNSIGSPQDGGLSALSTLRQENERLQRGLSEARAELMAETRRANDLERQLQQQEQQDAARRREQPAVTQRLRQQVTLLKVEVEALHRENEAMRLAGGACGGSRTSCDRATSTSASAVAAAAAGLASTINSGSSAATAASTGATKSSSNISRPSKTQQLSRDLLRAASNAENNLRQLLAGVDNLRQMASSLDNATLTIDFDASPDLYADFVEDEQDFEHYAGGGGAGAGAGAGASGV